MKKILLTKNRYTLVDDSDYDLLVKHRWCSTKGYAVSRIKGEVTLMHRVIMGARKGQVCDHVNHNRLDNRRSNLRLCSYGENSRNRIHGELKGITFVKRLNKWQSQITVDYKNIYLGLFPSPKDAQSAYKNASILYHKEFSPYWSKAVIR